MPANKSQHYVPKFYLRNFANDADRKNVSVYNLKREILIPNASIKDQCAKDYYYGEDGSLETDLAQLEAKASVILKRAREGDDFVLAGWDQLLLAMFLCLQDARTVRAAHRAATMSSQILERSLANFPGAKNREELKEGDPLNVSMQSVALFPIVADLKFIVLRNQTDVEFITSDHPIVKRNKFQRGVRIAPRGLASSGLVLLLPVSPRSLILGFDQGIYTSDADAKRIAMIDDVRAVDEINEAVVADAHDNIYATRAVSFLYLAAMLDKVREARLAPLSSIQEFVRSKTRGMYVRKGDPTADVEHPGVLLSSSESAQRTSPSLSVLRKRRGTIYYYDDGSAACPLRDRGWYLIVEEFSQGVRRGTIRFSRLPMFAKAHADFQRLRPWTRRLVEEL